MEAEGKRVKRLQNKKRKASALLAISELNDAEKASKKIKKDEQAEDEKVEEIKKLETSVKVTSKPLLEGEEYEELKRRLRERKKALSCNPIFRLKAVGEEALMNRKSRVPLFMSDIQHLLTFSMVGDRAPYWPHRWATLSKWNRLTNLVVLVIEKLGVDHLEGWPTMPLLEVTSPASYSSSMAEELALMPLTVSHKKRLIEEFGSLENSMEKGEAFKAFRSIFPITVNETKKASKEEKLEKECLKLRLLLSATQMVTENYPLPLAGSMQERYTNFKPTSDQYIEVSSTSPLFSVDCEMCLTDEGSELTRICVVDSTLAVVYHKLVKPTNQIRNYLTRYSGITPDMLEDVTTRLEDVQNDLQKILPPDAILVGQSLNCDLAAMKMVHPYVIDTSVCYNITGDRRRKSKLSTLAHLFLNMKIQTQGKHGHSPVEDAQTAMTLVNLKLEKGLAFGDVVLGGQVPVMDEEGVYKMPAPMEQGNPKKDWKHENLMTSLSKTLANHEKTVALVTDGGASQGYADFEGFRQELKLSQTLATSTAALEAARNAAVAHNLTICHLALDDEEKEEDRLSKAQEAATTLHNFTSINGMFILILAGTETQNAVAGVILRKPEADKL